MTVPQSILVVALALVWLAVLVPTSSRRRKHVKQVVDGRGFRVIRRPEAGSRRKVRRTVRRRGAGSAGLSEGEMSSQQTDLDPSTTDVRDDGPDRPDDAERTVQLALIRDDEVGPVTEEAEAELVAEADTSAAEQEADAPSGEHPEPVEHEEQSVDAAARADYRSWRDGIRTADPEPEAHPAERQIPRRPGRGTYDPEVAERERAFKYSRRRRTLLVLLLITAGFVTAAVTVMPSMWIGAAVAAVLTVLFMVYLRRQVKIEADIRDRRLAKLQRARQIRPETVAGGGRAAQPGHPVHRVGRDVVDLDDDDPSFDDLEQYEPVEYRRAVGQ